jgi:hypothetical protein
MKYKRFLFLIVLLISIFIQICYATELKNTIKSEKDNPVSIDKDATKVLVSNDAIKISFNKNSQYNAIYDKIGNLVVEKESMYLYCDKIYSDKTRAFTDSSKDATTKISQTYSNKDVSYSLVYDITDNKKMPIKISIDVTKSGGVKDNCVVRWELTNINAKSYKKQNNEYIFNIDKNKYLKISYNDVIRNFGKNTATPIIIQKVGGRYDLTIDFSIKDDIYYLDPSVYIDYVAENIPLYGVGQQMVMDSKKNLYLAYLYNNDIYVWNSSDYGKTWDDKIVSTGLDDDSTSSISMEILSDDSIHIYACIDDVGKQNLMEINSSNHVNWSRHTIHSEFGFYDCYDSYDTAVSSTDTLAVCLSTHNNNKGIEEYLVLTSTDKGKTWTNRSIFNQTKEISPCSIDFDSNNNLGVSLLNFSVTGSSCDVYEGDLWYLNSSSNFNTWYQTLVLENIVGDYGEELICNGVNLVFNKLNYPEMIINADSFVINVTDWSLIRGYVISPPGLPAPYYASEYRSHSTYNPVTGSIYGVLPTTTDYGTFNLLIFNISDISGTQYDTYGVPYILYGNDTYIIDNPTVQGSTYPYFNNPNTTVRYAYLDTTLNRIYYNQYKILNNAPLLKNTYINDTVYKTTNITGKVYYYDPDWDNATLLFKWYKNGTQVYNETIISDTHREVTSTLSSSYFYKEDLINFTVFANDNSTTSTTQRSNTIQVQNTAPVLSTVSLLPTTPSYTDTLVCNYTFSDADSDVIIAKYRWYKSDVLQTDANSYIVLNLTNFGEIWKCSVLINDTNATSGYINSSSVTIRDAIVPNISSISASSLSVYSDSSLLLSVFCQDSCSIISEVKGKVLKPVGVSDVSFSQTGINTWTYTYTDVTVLGVYNFTNVTCKDSSGNIAYSNDSTTFLSLLRPSSTGGSGGQGLGFQQSQLILPNASFFDVRTDNGGKRYDLFMIQNEKRTKKIIVSNLYDQDIEVKLSCGGDVCDNFELSKEDVSISKRDSVVVNAVINSSGLSEQTSNYFSVKGTLVKLNNTAINDEKQVSKVEIFVTITNLGFLRIYLSKFEPFNSMYYGILPRVLVYLLIATVVTWISSYFIMKSKVKLIYLIIIFISVVAIIPIFDDILINLIVRLFG